MVQMISESRRKLAALALAGAMTIGGAAGVASMVTSPEQNQSGIVMEAYAATNTQNVVYGESCKLVAKTNGVQWSKESGCTYQWYYKKSGSTNFSKWNGRTGISETVTPNTSWNGIQLYCIKTNSSGATTKSDVITIKLIVEITKQPQDIKAAPNNQVTLSVEAQGDDLQYQWYYKKASQSDYSKWSNHTTASTSAAVGADWDGIQFYCAITDANGIVTNSRVAKVTFASKPSFTKQPQNVRVRVGDTATFSATATGDSGCQISYQWYYKKVDASAWSLWNGHTTANTSAVSNATWNGMQVKCVATDIYGQKVDSSVATITTCNPIGITTDLTNMETYVDATVSFTIEATGDGLKYQWYKNRIAVSGATSSTYTMKVTKADEDAIIYCMLSDDNGQTKNSKEAKITIKASTTGGESKESAITISSDKVTRRSDGVPLRAFSAATDNGSYYAYFNSNFAFQCFANGKTTYETTNYKLTYQPANKEHAARVMVDPKTIGIHQVYIYVKQNGYWFKTIIDLKVTTASQIKYDSVSANKEKITFKNSVGNFHPVVYYQFGVKNADGTVTKKVGTTKLTNMSLSSGSFSVSRTQNGTKYKVGSCAFKFRFGDNGKWSNWLYVPISD